MIISRKDVDTSEVRMKMGISIVIMAVVMAVMTGCREKGNIVKDIELIDGVGKNCAAAKSKLLSMQFCETRRNVRNRLLFSLIKDMIK